MVASLSGRALLRYVPLMIEVIPAIDLLGGQCVRLVQGDYERSQVFSSDPLAMAAVWVERGATRLHLVDLDGAKTGQPTNHDIIGEIARQFSVPIQVGGGVRSLETVEALLSRDVERVIVGTIAVEQPDLVRSTCERFPGQIVVGIDAREGRVATRGWLETTEIVATDLVASACNWGAAAIIYTDILRDGMLSGPNLEQLRAIARASSIPIIASGGISSISNLLSLLPLTQTGTAGVRGAIVGKALYTGDIELPEAIQAVSNGRWQDVPPLGSNGSTFA